LRESREQGALYLEGTPRQTEILDVLQKMEEFRLKGNEAFKALDFSLAEEYYKKAIELDHTSHFLYTNLAAALFEQQKFDETIIAANQALVLEPTWVKAYFRKALAFEALGNCRDCFQTWTEAVKHCENSLWLKKQYEKSKSIWLKQFKSKPILDTSDLLQRYTILADSREKLSTLAHFWNLSSPEERMKHFLFFLEMIGGQTPSSETSLNLCVEMMQPMPMHNYLDLPMDHIQSWCDYFQTLDSNSKTSILEQFWYALTSKEQNDVVLDLQLFMSQAKEQIHNNDASSGQR
jgi:tetratricopeptide (TPR) repeat protein